jgi:hypothetical protein
MFDTCEENFLIMIVICFLVGSIFSALIISFDMGLAAQEKLDKALNYSNCKELGGRVIFGECLMPCR